MYHESRDELLIGALDDRTIHTVPEYFSTLHPFLTTPDPSIAQSCRRPRG
jgi:hypothetical protein